MEEANAFRKLNPRLPNQEYRFKREADVSNVNFIYSYKSNGLLQIMSVYAVKSIDT